MRFFDHLGFLPLKFVMTRIMNDNWKTKLPTKPKLTYEGLHIYNPLLDYEWFFVCRKKGRSVSRPNNILFQLIFAHHLLAVFSVFLANIQYITNIYHYCNIYNEPIGAEPQLGQLNSDHFIIMIFL